MMSHIHESLLGPSNPGRHRFLFNFIYFYNNFIFFRFFFKKLGIFKIKNYVYLCVRIWHGDVALHTFGVTSWLSAHMWQY